MSCLLVDFRTDLITLLMESRVDEDFTTLLVHSDEEVDSFLVVTCKSAMLLVVVEALRSKTKRYFWSVTVSRTFTETYSCCANVRPLFPVILSASDVLYIP